MNPSLSIRFRQYTIVMLFAVCVLSFAGCGMQSHRACTGGPLSKPEMQFSYRANDRLLDDHIYFSKEASSGGRGFGGGGCGCN